MDAVASAYEAGLALSFAGLFAGENPSSDFAAGTTRSNGGVTGSSSRAGRLRS